MKKIALFLTVFFFFGFVIAEDVQVYKDGSMILIGERWTEHESEAEPEPKKEPEPEPEPEKEPEVEKQEEEVEPETKEKPKFFYIQPAFETGAAMGVFFPRIGVALDAGFLVGSILDKTNVYLGLDFDLKLVPIFWSHPWPIISFPVLASTVFDIALQKQPVLKSISVRFSFGVNMWLSRIEHSSSDEIYSDLKFYADYGWGTGFDLVFKNSMVFKFSIEGYWIYFPDLLVGVGYRF